MNDTDLRTAFEQLGNAVPDVGDADLAIGRARRRRLVRRVGFGTPVVVAALVAATLGLVQLLPLGRPGVQPASPADSAPAFTLRDWAEPVSSTNSAARPGTLIHHCGPTCVQLRRPDGREISLFAERPDLLNRLRGNAFDSAGLSWDAQWLGVRVGREYRLYKLTDRNRSITVPGGPEGSRWEAVGWSPDSRYVVVAAFKSKRVVEYALVSLRDGKVTRYIPASGSRKLPERLDASGGVVIESPIDTSPPVGERTRVTELAADVLRLTADGQGTTRPLYDPAPDLARYLRADESLAGPRGVASSSCAPTSAGPDQPMCVTVVWGLVGGDDGSQSLHETGVVQTLAPDRPDAAVRWNIPRSFAWDYVGLLPTGEIAVSLLRDGSGDQEIVAIGSDGGRRVIGRVPFQSAILLPGMALPSCCRDW